MEKERNSNIELLRIIAMILIVAHHFAIHSGFSFPTTGLPLNKLWIQLIRLGGKIGVDIFVLISGYFLIKAKNIKISKILKFWLQVFTYSIIIYIIFVLSGVTIFNIKDFIHTCFPITYQHWWFASTYFVLYLISPFLNKLFNSLDKKTYQKLIILGIVCWCIIPTFTSSSFQSNSLIWFIYLYALAGYIRIYWDKIKISGGKCICLAILMTFLTYLWCVCFDLLGLKFPTLTRFCYMFYEMQTLPIVIISLFWLLGCLNINIKYNKLINLLGAATFGVYLISDESYIRHFIWIDLFKNASFSNSMYLIPYSLAVIFGVYIICTIIEILRIYILEKHYIKIVEKISNYLKKLIDKFFALKIFQKL